MRVLHCCEVQSLGRQTIAASFVAIATALSCFGHLHSDALRMMIQSRTGRSVLSRGVSSFQGVDPYLEKINFLYKKQDTVEPLNKGHFGTNHSVHCRETVLFLEVSECILTTGIRCYFWDIRSVLYERLSLSHRVSSTQLLLQSA